MKKGLYVGLLLMGMGWGGAVPASAGTYQIPIEISVPVETADHPGQTKAYSRLVLGAHPEATENYDSQWDTPAFFTTPDPENPPLLRAYIQHPEYAENRQQLWRDIRSDAAKPSKTWSVVISPAPSEIGKTVTVAWTIPPALAASREPVTLQDEEADTAVDMRAQSSYRYINGSTSPKTLSVTISPAGGSSDKGSSGFFGCGVVKSVTSPPPGGGAAGVILINLLILLSPILLRFRRWRAV